MRVIPPLPEPSYLTRGVYVAPYLSQRGYPVVVAVGRDHRHVGHRVLRPDVNPDEAQDYLWGLLERNDPAPRLQLVRDDDDHELRPLSPAAFASYMRALRTLDGRS